MRPEVGPHGVQRIGHPALDVVRVQTMHQQQAGHQVVGGQAVGEVGIGRSGDPQHPLQAGAVEVGYLTDQLFGAFARDGATRRARVEQGLYPIARRAPLRVILGFVRAMGHTLFPGCGLSGGVQ